MVAGLEEPDYGSVVRRRNLYIRYLPQIPVFTRERRCWMLLCGKIRDEPHFSSGRH